VDEKTCRAALEKIPTPSGKYDSWSSARPSEPEEKSGGKANRN